MRSKILILIITIVCGVCLYAIRYRQYFTANMQFSSITLANILALTEGEDSSSDAEKGNDDTEKGDGITDSEIDFSITPVYYQSMHFPVYNVYNQKTNKCTATCYQSPTSKNPVCHSHKAKECCHE